MILFILNFLVQFSFAADIPPTAFPVFLKLGFSSVLEFDDSPIKVVLGDSQNFQIERLSKSLIIKTLANENTSNLFVYFKNLPTRLFILTASDEAEPTLYRKFENMIPPTKVIKNIAEKTRVTFAKFNPKKDYLTVEVLVASASTLTKPNWDQIHLAMGDKLFRPTKIWSERKEIQKDAYIKARFLFYRPDVPKNLRGVSLVLPLGKNLKSLQLPLGGHS